MSFYSKASFFLLVFILFSCTNNDSSNSQVFVVEGYVYSQNKAIEKVKVTFDDFTNLEAVTNKEGYFKVAGIKEGAHEIKLSKSTIENNKDSSFTEKTFKVNISENTTLENLKLPSPVILEEGDEIESINLTLNWSISDDDNFREYKIYRHNTSGIDETTGLLVHVSTVRQETTFTDSELTPLTNYFYRVYVLDDLGRIGGSNIIEVKTKNTILIKNGSFEEVENNLPTFWNLFTLSESSPNKIFLSNLAASEGVYSIEIDAPDAQAVTGLYQAINGNLLTAGGTYRLTFDFKTDKKCNLDIIYSERNRNFPTFHTEYTQLNPTNSIWEKFTFDLTFPNDFNSGEFTLRLHFHNFDFVKTNIDNVNFERIN